MSTNQNQRPQEAAAEPQQQLQPQQHRRLAVRAFVVYAPGPLIENVAAVLGQRIDNASTVTQSTGSDPSVALRRPAGLPPIFNSPFGQIQLVPQDTATMYDSLLQQQREMIQAFQNDDGANSEQNERRNRQGLFRNLVVLQNSGVALMHLPVPVNWTRPVQSSVIVPTIPSSCRHVIESQIRQLQEWLQLSLEQCHPRVREAAQLRIVQLEGIVGGHVDANTRFQSIINVAHQVKNLVTSSLIKKDPLEAVRTIIEVLDIPVNNYTVCPEGTTLLELASLLGRLDVVQYLVEERLASIDRQDFKGRSALHFAVRAGSFSVVSYLVKRGARINTQDTSDGCTPLHCAFINPAMSRYLIEHGADTWKIDNEGTVAFERALVAAAYGNDPDFFRTQFLKHRDFLVSYITWLFYMICHTNLRSVYGSQPSLDVLKFLVEDQHVNPKSPAPNGDTALHFASFAGCTHEALYWIDHCGMDLHATNNDGMSALHLAAKGGHFSMVRLLLSRGMDLSKVDKAGRTSLHWAFFGGNDALVNWCVKEQKMDVHQRDNNECSALDVGMKQGHMNLVQWFLFSLHHGRLAESPLRRCRRFGKDAPTKKARAAKAAHSMMTRSKHSSSHHHSMTTRSKAKKSRMR